MENCVFVPSTALALQLGRALERPVEALLHCRRSELHSEILSICLRRIVLARAVEHSKRISVHRAASSTGVCKYSHQLYEPRDP